MLKKAKEQMIKFRIVIPVKNFTCTTCQDWKTCTYAFDLYNQAGDCLREK